MKLILIYEVWDQRPINAVKQKVHQSFKEVEIASYRLFWGRVNSVGKPVLCKLSFTENN